MAYVYVRTYKTKINVVNHNLFNIFYMNSFEELIEVWNRLYLQYKKRQFV